MLPKSNVLSWTLHAQMKMGHYRLSAARVRRVLHAPKRVGEGVAPKTVAMMQPASFVQTAHGTESWAQEIWVMVQDTGKNRKVISAWRYPGVTKPRSTAALGLMRREYDEFLSDEKV
jgi:hypothetical protein